MNIDELQERFNELRAKKWRTVHLHKHAEFVGFLYNPVDPRVMVNIDHQIVWLLLDLSGPNNPGFPIIEEDTPYTDWPIDAKVWVWDEGETKNKRHFAGITPEGRPKAWNDGYTSWITNAWSSWQYAELAED